MTGTVPPQLLHEIFAAALQRHGDRVAVDVPPGFLRPQRRTRTYAELWADAERVCAAVSGGQEERVIALLLDRTTPWLYAGQLGAMRAGAAYVALDRSYPDERIALVLRDAGAAIVLTDAAGKARLTGIAGVDAAIVDVAELPVLPPAAPTDRFGGAAAGFGGDRLCYLIYTSGTTGRPKAVMVEHRSIANLVLGDVAEFGLGPGDRVAQGSSAAYDSSVEESWLAFAVGGTVVPLDDDAARSGPDLVPWLQRERISVLCPPPTLLQASGCADPERALPLLRLLYVGGEALPQELADRWAKGRRMVNGYGPTECTVTVTRAEVRPGQPVTIGRPVPGSAAYVLDEDLREAAPGSWGELCIGGASLARGYLGQEQETERKFVQHPVHGRLYRTGDRVRWDERGELVYGGRLDAQVKLRGHRVELGEIEARIVAGGGIRAAACTVQDGGTLVAFVVLADVEADFDFAALSRRLAAELPAHMVPAAFGRVDALPTSVGGKLDRKALPRIEPRSEPRGRAPSGPLEALVAQAWRHALALPAVDAESDFFALGGNSLRAAVVISLLRDDPRTASLAVRDLYEAPTVAGLAVRAASLAATARRRRQGPDRKRQWPVLVTAAQTVWLLVELLAASSLAYALWFFAAPGPLAALGPLAIGLLAAPAFVALRLLSLWPTIALAALAKRLLIGRYEAGRHPAWGSFFLRHWIVVRLVRLAPWNLIQGTELQCWALRRLGARIGARVFLHRGVDLLRGGWDLLEIGDDASLGLECGLGLAEYDDGCLALAPVRIGAGATLAVRSGMGGHTALGAGAQLLPLACLHDGGAAPPGEVWDGTPASRVGSVDRALAPDGGGPALGAVSHAAHVLGGRVLLRILPAVAVGLFAYLLCALHGPEASVHAWLLAPAGGIGDLGALSVFSAALLCVVLALQAISLRVLPKAKAATVRVRSKSHVLWMLRSSIVDGASIWLSGTLFWPMWLRLAGARIGPKTEVSTILDVLPEQLTIGARCFFADGIYLGGPILGQGLAQVAPVRIGDGVFLGNHVVVKAGARIPDGVLLGVATVADPARLRAGSSWFGQPAFELPRREVVEADLAETFEPGLLRVVSRVFWEALRLFVPTLFAAALLYWSQAAAALPAQQWATWLWRLPLVSLATSAAMVGVIVASKWLLLGRVRPGKHGLWSCWCSRWDFLYVLWGLLARSSLQRLCGTLWLGWFLRLVGVKVGRRVLLGGSFAQVVDPDMLQFEDDATVDSMFQAHSFEDRVLKIDRVRVGKGATLRRASVVLYGADIGDGASVGAHAVVMKNERLLPQIAYEGAPTRPVSAE